MVMDSRRSTVNGKPTTVVIADDDATTRSIIKDRLEELGYEVVGAAADGQGAVEMAKKLCPSLVILDLMMPRMSGMEAARAITAIEPVPIILVTAYSSDELAEEAIEAGVFSYLIKPVTEKDLLPAIKLAMARFKEFSGLKDEVKDLKEAIEARKVIEKAKGILMKRGNIDENEAYRMLQGQSQKERRKMREISEMVISASKLL
jgi:response regulator NasT